MQLGAYCYISSGDLTTPTTAWSGCNKVIACRRSPVWLPHLSLCPDLLPPANWCLSPKRVNGRHMQLAKAKESKSSGGHHGVTVHALHSPEPQWIHQTLVLRPSPVFARTCDRVPPYASIVSCCSIRHSSNTRAGACTTLTARVTTDVIMTEVERAESSVSNQEQSRPAASTSDHEQPLEANVEQNTHFTSQPAPDTASRKAARKTQQLQVLQQGFRKRGDTSVLHAHSALHA